MRLGFSRGLIGWWRLAVVSVCAWVLSGCSSTGALPPAPLTAANSAEHIYKIGPLDTLNIVVWQNADLSGKVTVRPDGHIAMPLVQDIQAAGRSPVELARDIEKSLGTFIRDPVVTVVMNSVPGASSEQVRVVGEAAKPQAVPCRQNMTVMDVMIQVGGLTDYADGNGAVLVRGAERGAQYRLRLKDLLKRGDISANAEVIPGDIIIVPQSLF